MHTGDNEYVVVVDDDDDNNNNNNDDDDDDDDDDTTTTTTTTTTPPPTTTTTTNNNNNRCDWNHFKITQTIRDQHTGKVRSQGTANNSHIGHCTHTLQKVLI